MKQHEMVLAPGRKIVYREDQQGNITDLAIMLEPWSMRHRELRELHMECYLNPSGLFEAHITEPEAQFYNRDIQLLEERREQAHRSR